MNMRLPEIAKQQWELAADSMPQFVCLLDHECHVIRVNRSVERCKLGIDIEDAGGLCLHEVLHRDCDNARCYLRRFEERAAAALAKGRRANCDAWDPILKRHFLIRARTPILTQRRTHSSLGEVFAVITVDDVTEFKAIEKQSEGLTRALRRSVKHEQGKRTEANLAAYCGQEQDMSEWIKKDEAVRATQSELRRVAAQQLAVVETERRRIAAELHDGLGQSLSLLKLGIREALSQMTAGAPQKALESVTQLLPKVAGALDELRRVSMELRPSTLDDLGILPTLSWFVRETEGTHPDIKIEKHISVSEKDVPEPLKLAIFRILQEAVNNALKHSGAGRISVSLQSENAVLTFSVEDDGKGFDPSALDSRCDARRGLGLQGMRDRAELSGGAYALKSTVGEGTKICVWWPALKATDAYRDRAEYALSGPQSDGSAGPVALQACYRPNAADGVQIEREV